jgi:type IV secretory pathway VirB4 component
MITSLDNAMNNEELNRLLKSSRNQKFRNQSQAQLDAGNARLAGLKASLANPEFAKQRSKKQRENNPDMQERIAKSIRLHYEDNPMPEERKQRISKALQGKSLEEIVGKERAKKGRESRSNAHLGKKRPASVGKKIAQTRRENGSYDGSSMRGKEHKDSTKSIMSIKAKVRQELKIKLGLGKNDKVPKELLEKEYKKRGI